VNFERLELSVLSPRARDRAGNLGHAVLGIDEVSAFGRDDLQGISIARSRRWPLQKSTHVGVLNRGESGQLIVNKIIDGTHVSNGNDLRYCQQGKAD
jgi:hypothetical protein